MSSPSPTAFNTLPPTLVRIIHEAFDDAVGMLDRTYASDKVRAAISHHIVELARHGECDVIRLRDSALKVVHFHS